MKKKLTDENVKKFSDFSNKSWIMENDSNLISIGETALKLMKGESTKIEIKEMYFGDPWQTFKIIVDQNDQLFLVKTSRELK
jgi:hypothetical protein